MSPVQSCSLELAVVAGRFPATIMPPRHVQLFATHPCSNPSSAASFFHISPFFPLCSPYPPVLYSLALSPRSPPPSHRPAERVVCSLVAFLFRCCCRFYHHHPPTHPPPPPPQIHTPLCVTYMLAIHALADCYHSIGASATAYIGSHRWGAWSREGLRCAAPGRTLLCCGVSD